MNYDQTFIGKRFIDEMEEIAHDSRPDLSTMCTTNISNFGPYGTLNWGNLVGNCNGGAWNVGYTTINGVKAISSLFAVFDSKQRNTVQFCLSENSGKQYRICRHRSVFSLL